MPANPNEAVARLAAQRRQGADVAEFKEIVGWDDCIVPVLLEHRDVFVQRLVRKAAGGDAGSTTPEPMTAEQLACHAEAIEFLLGIVEGLIQRGTDASARIDALMTKRASRGPDTIV